MTFFEKWFDNIYTNEELYAFLVEKFGHLNYRVTRFEVVSYCIGYFGDITEEIYDCIQRLYIDNFVDD